jgi:hypothetical protein
MIICDDLRLHLATPGIKALLHGGDFDWVFLGEIVGFARIGAEVVKQRVFITLLDDLHVPHANGTELAGQIGISTGDAPFFVVTDEPAKLLMRHTFLPRLKKWKQVHAIEWDGAFPACEIEGSGKDIHEMDHGLIAGASLDFS